MNISQKSSLGKWFSQKFTESSRIMHFSLFDPAFFKSATNHFLLNSRIKESFSIEKCRKCSFSCKGASAHAHGSAENEGNLFFPFTSFSPPAFAHRLLFSRSHRMLLPPRSAESAVFSEKSGKYRLRDKNLLYICPKMWYNISSI